MSHMNKVLKKEQHIARHHPITWPLIVILGGTILIALVLLILLIQSKNENSDLHKKLDQNQPVQNFENQQEQDFTNTVDGL